MKTNLSDQENQRLIVTKIAENNNDEKVLLQIYKNSIYVQKYYPDFVQPVIAYEKDRLMLSGFYGSSFTSEEAVGTFLNEGWITNSVVGILERFQKREHIRVSLGSKIRTLFYPLLYGAELGCKIFPEVVKSSLQLFASQEPWIDSHGDFTVYNLIIDAASQSVSLIDWESFNIRPKHYDFFTLVFNHSIPIESMNWQTILAEKYGSNIHRIELRSSQTWDVAILVLFRYYFLEVYRQKNINRHHIKSKYPQKTSEYFRHRAETRLRNFKIVVQRENWDHLINGWSW